jgi:hypothetical protein
MISLAAARARTASSAIVSEAAKTLSRILQVGSARTAQCMQLTLHLLSNYYLDGQRSGDEDMGFSCRASRVASRRRGCYGSHNTQSHWQRTPAAVIFRKSKYDTMDGKHKTYADKFLDVHKLQCSMLAHVHYRGHSFSHGY